MSLNYLQVENQKNDHYHSSYEVPSVYTRRSMGIGFSGSHRTGKTVTAQRVAEKLNVEFVNAHVSSSRIWTSFQPSDSMTFGERIQVQEFLLTEMETLLSRISLKNDQFVIDRTPIDLLGYLLTNIDSTVSIIFNERSQAFIQKCINLTTRYFSHFIVIPPGITFLNEGMKTGKVYNSQVYQESLTNVILGSYYRYLEQMNQINQKCLIVIPDHLIDLNERVEFILTSLSAFPSK